MHNTITAVALQSAYENNINIEKNNMLIGNNYMAINTNNMKIFLKLSLITLFAIATIQPSFAASPKASDDNQTPGSWLSFAWNIGKAIAVITPFMTQRTANCYRQEAAKHKKSVKYLTDTLTRNNLDNTFFFPDANDLSAAINKYKTNTKSFNYKYDYQNTHNRSDLIKSILHCAIETRMLNACSHPDECELLTEFLNQNYSQFNGRDIQIHELARTLGVQNAKIYPNKQPITRATGDLDFSDETEPPFPTIESPAPTADNIKINKERCHDGIYTIGQFTGTQDNGHSQLIDFKFGLNFEFYDDLRERRDKIINEKIIEKNNLRTSRKLLAQQWQNYTKIAGVAATGVIVKSVWDIVYKQPSTALTTTVPLSLPLSSKQNMHQRLHL